MHQTSTNITPKYHQETHYNYMENSVFFASNCSPLLHYHYVSTSLTMQIPTETLSQTHRVCFMLLCYRSVTTALTAQIPAETLSQSHRLCFIGKERDSETGFSYFGARYYDSDILTGWLSVDPLADKYPNLSPYAYCAWNPIRLVDPDGRDGVLKVDGKNLTIQLTINYSPTNLANVNKQFGYTLSNLQNDFNDYLKNTEIDYNGTKYTISFDIVFNEVSGCYENLKSMPKASVGSVNLFFDGFGSSSHNSFGIFIGSPKSVINNLGGTFAHEILHTLGIPDSDRNPEREEGPLSSYTKKRYPIGKDELLNILTPSLELIEKIILKMEIF